MPPKRETANVNSTSSNRATRKRQPTLDEVVSYFAACGRCSFFLAAYQLEYGTDHLQTAVAQSKGGWMTLKWDKVMRELVHKSFASRIESDCYHYEGYCLECRRRFVFRAAGETRPSDSFRIELKSRHFAKS